MQCQRSQSPVRSTVGFGASEIVGQKFVHREYSMIRGSTDGVRPFISDVESVGRQSAARDRLLNVRLAEWVPPVGGALSGHTSTWQVQAAGVHRPSDRRGDAKQLRGAADRARIPRG
jgi:hypothetical protein